LDDIVWRLGELGRTNTEVLGLDGKLELLVVPNDNQTGFPRKFSRLDRPFRLGKASWIFMAKGVSSRLPTRTIENKRLRVLS